MWSTIASVCSKYAIICYSKYNITFCSKYAVTCYSHKPLYLNLSNHTLAKLTEFEFSFDVVYLFTNVPVDLTISVVSTRLAQDTSLCDHMCLTADEVTMLLSFCLNATYCAFAGQFFKQSFGTAMGLPVSVMVANPVMKDLEERALLTYTRLCKSTIGVSHFHPMKCHLSIPNSTIKPRIKFTIEHEQDRGFLS